MSASLQSSAFVTDYRPLQGILPSYLYKEYSDDENLQAFVDSYNMLAQSYLDWFNQTPLAVYTSPNISGSLLDWIGNGIYGIRRPVLTSSTIIKRSGYNSFAYNTLAYNAMDFSQTGNATTVNDDIYKRVLAWHLYRGDGQVFSLFWLKRRISRFLNGANGSDYPVLDSPPSITLSGTTFTISASSTSMFLILQQAIANGILALPFQYTFIVANYLESNGGLLQVSANAGWPTSSVGLSAGAIWNDGGVAAVVPGVTPNPAAPPVYFYSISAGALLALGGGNLPTSNPGVGSTQLWNNGGSICIA